MSTGDLFVNGEPFNLDAPPAGGDATPPPEGGTGGGAQDRGDPWAAIDKLNQELAARDAQIAALRQQGEAPPTPPAQTQTGAAPDIDALKAKLGKQFIEDPGGTLIQMMSLMQQQSQANALQSVGVVKEQLVEDAIESFKDRQRVADPAFAAVEETFDKVVEEEMRANRGSIQNLTPAQIKKGIKSMYELAAGRVALERSRRRENEPPPYSFGSTGSGGTVRTNGGGKRLTKSQQAVYDSAMADHGYTAEDAMKIALGAEVEE